MPVQLQPDAIGTHGVCSPTVCQTKTMQNMGRTFSRWMVHFYLTRTLSVPWNFCQNNKTKMHHRHSILKTRVHHSTNQYTGRCDHQGNTRFIMSHTRTIKQQRWSTHGGSSKNARLIWSSTTLTYQVAATSQLISKSDIHQECTPNHNIWP